MKFKIHGADRDTGNTVDSITVVASNELEARDIASDRNIIVSGIQPIMWPYRVVAIGLVLLCLTSTSTVVMQIMVINDVEDARDKANIAARYAKQAEFDAANVSSAIRNIIREVQNIEYIAEEARDAAIEAKNGAAKADLQSKYARSSAESARKAIDDLNRILESTKQVADRAAKNAEEAKESAIDAANAAQSAYSASSDAEDAANAAKNASESLRRALR